MTKEVSNQINKFICKDIRPNVEVLYLGAKNYEIIDKKELKDYRQSLDSQDCLMIGLVGRINEFKGQHLLIEAMKELVSKKLNIKAFIVGNAMDDSYLESLKTKLTEYNLNDNVKFLGFTNEPNKFMQTCDVILMTSKNETFGLVTIEAMQNGTCVIGANSGGVLEIIDDDETGLLFENSNVSSLSSKIETLYNDKELRDKLALGGQKKANECFNNDMQFKKLINIINSL